MENLSARGLKALFALKRYICTGNIKVRLGIKLFDQMIKPILCYASELWIACNLGKRKFRTEDGLAKYLDSTAIAKVHVSVNKRAVNLAVKGEFGRFPISFSCIIQAFRYRYHLQETSNSLLQEAAAVSKCLHNNRISTWFSFYDRVCKYINAKVDDPSAVVTLLSFLCEKFTVYWGNTISSFSKLDTYMYFLYGRLSRHDF